MFLTADEIVFLTGRKLKRLQIDALRSMGVPFLVNACGQPVVTRAALEGRASAHPEQKPSWAPAKLRRAA